MHWTPLSQVSEFGTDPLEQKPIKYHLVKQNAIKHMDKTELTKTHSIRVIRDYILLLALWPLAREPKSFHYPVTSPSQPPP